MIEYLLVNNKFGGIIFIVLVLLLGVTGIAILFYFSNAQPLPLAPTPIPSPTVVVDLTLSWKSLHLETLSFKYPSDWGEPEVLNAEFGKTARIESQSKNYQLNILTGINQGYSLEENKQFLEEMKVVDGKGIQLLGGSASVYETRYAGTKSVAAFLLSDNNHSYSIVLVTAEDDPNATQFMDQILGTVRFSD